MANLNKVAKTKDIPAGKAIAVTVADKRIAVFNVGGKFFAINDTCTHAGGSLSEGEIAGTVVTCPWHGATFDISKGTPLNDIAPEPLNSYKVVVVGEDVNIEI